MILATAGFVILGALIAFFALGSDSGGSASTAPISSNACAETTYPGLSPKHLSNPSAKVEYNSFPPSSGPHYQSPAPWNIYEEPIKETILVHNLEHGGIVIQYGPGVSKADVGKIQSFYRDDPYGLVVAPYSKLGSKIALTAWNEPAYRQEGDFKNVDAGNGYVLKCTQFDGNAFAKFRDTRRNKAGERYSSVKDMAPGS